MTENKVLFNFNLILVITAAFRGETVKVAIIGANGQLGCDLGRVYREQGCAVTEFTHAHLEIAAAESCRAALAGLRPDLVINTAAFHQVEACELDPVLACAVNGLGPRHLALLAEELQFRLVHFSTDYVFDGARREPYMETDLPLPLNVYGNTKLSGELFVRSLTPRHFVVRVSGLYGAAPCRAKGGLNFVQLMLKLARERGEVRVVADEILTPTATRDVARQLAQLTATDHYGLYHMTCQGQCSWYDFAARIFQLAGVRVTLSVAGPGEFRAKTPRPNYSVLENRALKELDLDIMPHWTDSLARYLQELEQ